MRSNSPLNFKRNGEVSLKWLHRFALLTSITTFFLIFVGGLVKSHEAGLSVPDWPTTYGEFMLTFPYSKWVGNIFYEHSHRLLATLTGFFITVEAIWLQVSSVDKRLKIVGWITFVGVCVQGYLGGMTVKYLLPVSISTGHSMLAQTVFCLTLFLATVTSRRWTATDRLPESGNLSLRKLSAWTVGSIFFQIMLGALMRHENAGLAIPTFPLANGRLIPEFSSLGIALNFAHRVGAIIVAVFVVTTVFASLRNYRNRELSRPAVLALVLLVLQITLGAITILSEKAVTPTTLHVSIGTALLGTMLFFTLRVFHTLEPSASLQPARSGLGVAANLTVSKG